MGGRLVALGAAALAVATLVVLLAFAGTPGSLAEGIRIGGVDVGGMSLADAQTLLERRAADLSDDPVVFTAASRRFPLAPGQLGVTADWAAAIEAARRRGDGFGPVRGFRRIGIRLFGAEVAPPVRATQAAVTYAVGEIAAAVERPAREAAIELRGLVPVVTAAAAGRALDVPAAETLVVRALAGFPRASVALPVQVAPPSVTRADLEPTLRQVRLALSAPVRLDLGGTVWRLPKKRIAELLALPSGGRTELAVGGPRAERYLERIAELVAREPKDASFVAASDGTVSVVPAAAGTRLDRLATADAILAAATSPASRLAKVVVGDAEPAVTTAEAKGMGITRVLTTYSTGYAGSSDRIRNLQLAVSLLDGALVAPGATFSFNDRVGERTAERGFRSAPVIINGEYEEDIGGGVSQVATTVFNAAWEAGLKIPVRAAHALYISRYPLGRDATVNYPDLDLRFENDTERWLLLRAYATDVGIAVSIWGAPTGRRVESEAGPLLETGPVPVKRVSDPTLERGQTVVEEEGQPPRVVSVKRTVYRADGSVLYAETWRTAYRGEKKVVRVGTKPKPKPAPEPKPAKPEEEEPAATGPTTTEPAPPPPPSG